MTLVADILERDPRNNRLINNGQARLDGDDQEARGELTSFVCEGRYADAFEKIIETFLADLDRKSQQATWVSGFFGSGKSHLLKMLALLWENTAYDDGVTPRQLVSELPEGVADQLAALDAEAKRRGGLVAAAASMPSGSYDRPRQAVLAIILKAAGLPADYGRARFHLYLEERGLLDQVAHALEAEGSSLQREIADLYVSPIIARVLSKIDPTLGSAKEVRETLKAQFRAPEGDIDTDAMVDVAVRALKRRGAGGELPLTLIVLDEVQIYIGDSIDRSGLIAEIAETFAKNKAFEQRVMLVGAGQSALTGARELAKLLDRFTIRIQLDDNDVETVTRRVLLRKKAAGIVAVEATLESNAAAVTRQLQSTRIATRPEDRQTAPEDYPLLPVRRRFWDACFRAVDVAGTQSQLRSQLRILHDALADVADRKLGAVVPADALYDALKPALVQSGVLPRDAYERVEKLADLYGDDGALAHRLAGLAFLVSRLPDEAGADIGVRATPEHLADLLVDDLTVDQGAFRERVRKLVDAMVDKGDLIRMGDELRIQTQEGRAWEQEFLGFRGHFQNDVAAFADERNRMLREAIQASLAQVTPTHGESRTARRIIAAFFQDRAPDRDDKNVPAWIRSEWEVSDKDARAAARQLGSDDGLIHVFVPKSQNTELRDALADMLAAQRTVDRRGAGHTDAAQDARRSMETRVTRARQRALDLVDGLAQQAIVMLGGGSTVAGTTLTARLSEANDIARKRLFPRFDEGDRPIGDWTKVARAARDGAEAPYATVSAGEPDAHPVGQEILQYAGAGKSGADIRKYFERAPFGWPQDAIDAALLALARTSKLSAILNGEAARLSHLGTPEIAKTTFRREETVIRAKDRLALRALFGKAGVDAGANDDLSVTAQRFLDKLAELARDAGGEPPFPLAPQSTVEDQARGRFGNELLQYLLDERSALEAAIEDRKARVALRKTRGEAWARAQELARHAGDAVKPALEELDDIRQHRRLLDPTDPLAQPVTKLREHLVKELTAAHTALDQRVNAALADLDKDPVWTALNEAARTRILTETELRAPPSPDTSSDKSILASLAVRPLGLWHSELDAVSGRQARAAEAAAKLAEPKVRTVHMERATLRTEADIDAWLGRQRERLIAALADGPAMVS